MVFRFLAFQMSVGSCKCIGFGTFGNNFTLIFWHSQSDIGLGMSFLGTSIDGNPFNDLESFHLREVVASELV